jgi:hypothetical protein
MDMGRTGIPGERVTSLLEPDTLLPAQYFDSVGAETAFQPEKRLMLAVLEEAIATFQRHASSETQQGRRLVQDVEGWVAGAAGDWPFSFENICVALDLEPEYLRAGLARWKEGECRKLRAQRQTVYRFPFRRVNGRRHSVTGPREYLRKSA